jgi:hypothetical protein
LLIQWNCCSLVHWQYNINLIPKCEHDFNLICTSSWTNTFNQLHIFYGTCLRDLIAFLSMTEVCWKCITFMDMLTIQNCKKCWHYMEMGQVYKQFVKNVKVRTIDIAQRKSNTQFIIFGGKYSFFVRKLKPFVTKSRINCHQQSKGVSTSPTKPIVL